MKEYEKLGHDAAKSIFNIGDISLTQEVDCKFCRGYVAGFQKARKMIADKFKRASAAFDPSVEVMQDIFVTTIMDVGEKEV